MTLTHSLDCKCTKCNPTEQPPALFADCIDRGGLTQTVVALEYDMNVWFVVYVEKRIHLGQELTERATVRNWNTSAMLHTARNKRWAEIDAKKASRYDQTT